MVERLRAQGIADPRVLAAMGEIPRERFVPADVAAQAYEDVPLPIGEGQTISAPWIVAFTTEVLRLTDRSHCLEIGTGSGYAAAVLSRCCATVVTVERHRPLAERAERVLAEVGCDNVEVRVGNGIHGAADHAPYDGIAVTAMADRRPPRALLDQLAPDGTLVCPVGRRSHGDLIRIRGGRRERLVQVAFVPLVDSD
ncbi:MAG: protein-L-isoaspartate(D-aspartate) O-methyltransferase [Streptosporangiales bacterium]|nr:protein-L-isoaspartate(D-aspartate) O-methyltransferase [Streptosporangiales bacterium]